MDRLEENFDWRERPRLVEEVARVIRGRIYSGQYAPGRPLRQVELAETLRISRTPLREALRILEQEGLVTADTVRGVNVINAGPRQILDAYQVRQVLDGLAARLAAACSADRAIAELQPVLERQRQTLEPWDIGEYTAANVDFHTRIFELSGNEYVIRQIPTIYMTSQVFRPGAKHERAADAVQEHTAIMQAIADGDAASAERLALTHVQKTIDMVVSWLPVTRKS
ncbi:GntR family transcriptional regulator [Bordetella sp. N]|uniref:GntR family transcriptional regulator n=1 Tax=Bordetella sp. N TaxID=1746199 RepID=UPI0009EC8CDA|nr:GntR family transcriptional regulator [Bordetella sp. N]